MAILTKKKSAFSGAARRKRSLSTSDVEHARSSFKSKKMPNFAAIHQKHMKKMESIVDYEHRKQDRAEKLGVSSEKKNPPVAPKSPCKDCLAFLSIFCPF